MELTIIAVFILLSLLFFYITTKSINKLRTEIFSSYPFDIFFPQGGKWSVGYFLVAIILLGLLIYFLAKGGFYSEVEFHPSSPA